MKILILILLLFSFTVLGKTIYNILRDKVSIRDKGFFVVLISTVSIALYEILHLKKRGDNDNS